MLQAFATLILGARGRSNIFQHHTAFARCLAVSILFQGGPGIGSTKRKQNRFRLEGAPAVAQQHARVQGSKMPVDQLTNIKMSRLRLTLVDGHRVNPTVWTPESKWCLRHPAWPSMS